MTTFRTLPMTAAATSADLRWAAIRALAAVLAGLVLACTTPFAGPTVVALTQTAAAAAN